VRPQGIRKKKTTKRVRRKNIYTNGGGRKKLGAATGKKEDIASSLWLVDNANDKGGDWLSRLVRGRGKKRERKETSTFEPLQKGGNLSTRARTDIKAKM